MSGALGIGVARRRCPLPTARAGCTQGRSFPALIARGGGSLQRTRRRLRAMDDKRRGTKGHTHTQAMENATSTKPSGTEFSQDSRTSEGADTLVQAGPTPLCTLSTIDDVTRRETGSRSGHRALGLRIECVHQTMRERRQQGDSSRDAFFVT